MESCIIGSLFLMFPLKQNIIDNPCKFRNVETFFFLNTDGMNNLHTYIYTYICMLLLSHFSRVRLCVTPSTAVHQIPPSLGFYRQEHWSGLPFPSPIHEKWKVKVKSLSRAWLLATPWTAAYQAPPSMGFSRQEYWNGVPLPSRDIYVHKHKNMSLNIFGPCAYTIEW